MQLTNILLTLMAATAAVAAPTSDENALARRGCPKGWAVCGECNGTSCKVAGTNRACASGSCTKQSGAGDGAICGSSNPFAGPMDCPGH